MKKFAVGDPITVYVKESSQAAQEGKTEASKKSEVNGSIFDLFQQFANAVTGTEQNQRTRQFKVGGGDSFEGEGKTSRKSAVTSVLTVTVADLMPNGNLVVNGQRRVKVNEELETIQIRGEIRPSDVSAENSVFSYQIANAEVTMKGAGVVSQKQSPGVLTRALNWLF